MNFFNAESTVHQLFNQPCESKAITSKVIVQIEHS